MSLLDTIMTGKSNLPPRILLYGYEGIGKSTFAANAEKPIFIQTEDGLRQLDVPKFPVTESYEDTMKCLYTLVTEEHGFKTVVVDSLSMLEKFIWDDVCNEFKVKNIEKADGGFAKGYKHAMNRWNDFLTLLDRANKKNMTIILIAHVGTQEVKDPENSTFDRTAPRLHKLAEGAISQWCDAVLFAHKDIIVRQLDEGFGNSRGVALDKGDDVRVIRTVGSAAVIAKNRYNLPAIMPLDYVNFYNAINEKQNN